VTQHLGSRQINGPKKLWVVVPSRLHEACWQWLLHTDVHNVHLSYVDQLPPLACQISENNVHLSYVQHILNQINPGFKGMFHDYTTLQWSDSNITHSAAYRVHL